MRCSFICTWSKAGVSLFLTVSQKSSQKEKGIWQAVTDSVCTCLSMSSSHHSTSVHVVLSWHPQSAGKPNMDTQQSSESSHECHISSAIIQRLNRAACIGGPRGCRRSCTGHDSARQGRWSTRSRGIWPWCQTSLIHKCCAAGSRRASCQVWSHFRLMSADISLKWLQTCEREISDEFLVLRRRN